MFSLLLSLILLYRFSRLELRIRCISREKLPTKMFASAGNINSKNNYEPVLIISTAGVFFSFAPTYLFPSTGVYCCILLKKSFLWLLNVG